MKKFLVLLTALSTATVVLTGCKHTKKQQAPGQVAPGQVVPEVTVEVRVSGTHADHIIWEEADLK